MYNLEKKELKKHIKNFKKTVCGKIIFLFSLLPGILAIASLFGMICSMLECYIDSSNNKDIIVDLLFISMSLNGSIYAIAQLLYYNMLNKYISSCSK